MAGGSCIRCGTDDGEGQFRAENSPVTWVGRYWDRTSDLLGVNQVLPVSGGVCDGHRLLLNWAIAPSDSYRHLTTLRRMAPENGSPDLEDQQPPCRFKLLPVSSRLPGVAVSGRWLLVDVVVAHGKPCQQRFAVGVGADSEQGPAVRARETPGQRVDLADLVDAQTLRPRCLTAVCPRCQRGDQLTTDSVSE